MPPHDAIDKIAALAEIKGRILECVGEVDIYRAATKGSVAISALSPLLAHPVMKLSGPCSARLVPSPTVWLNLISPSRK